MSINLGTGKFICVRLSNEALRQITMSPIKDYAEALKDRLEACPELATPYLKVHYSRTWFTDAYGHKHFFIIRKGNGV